MERLKQDLLTFGISFDMQLHQLFHKYRDIEDETGDEDVEGRIVVVTGANGGIGLAVTTELVRRKAVVIMACRNKQKTQQAIQSIKKLYPQGQIIPVELDLSNLNSVRRCAWEIKEKVPHINILINNAGVLWNTSKIERTDKGFETHIATNYLGHFLFTLLLVKHIKKGCSSRIVTVSSSAARSGNLDLDDLNWEKKDRHLGFMNVQPYADSKLANFYFSRELGKKLKGTGITTYALCPGIVNTNLTDTWTGLAKFFSKTIYYFGGITAESGAETVLYCALSKDVATETCKAYRYRSHWKTMDDQLQEDTALKLWGKSEEMTGVKWSSSCLKLKSEKTKNLLKIQSTL